MAFELALSTDWEKYVSHFGIDVMGTLATLYVQGFLTRRWQQFFAWLMLSLLVTVTTVNLIG